jgi:hypothetical protein
LSNLPTAAEAVSGAARKQTIAATSQRWQMPSQFPRINPKEQRVRGHERRHVLQEELAAEQARLQAALISNDAERALRSRADIKSLKHELAGTP